jgi:hypothetical protein
MNDRRVDLRGFPGSAATSKLSQPGTKTESALLVNLARALSGRITAWSRTV